MAIRGEGMPRLKGGKGDLYLIFDIQFPNSHDLSTDHKEVGGHLCILPPSSTLPPHQKLRDFVSLQLLRGLLPPPPRDERLFTGAGDLVSDAFLEPVDIQAEQARRRHQRRPGNCYDEDEDSDEEMAFERRRGCPTQ